MNTIRIRKTIESDTIHMPGLAPFVGHTVDIVIEDMTVASPTPTIIPGNGDWDAFGQAAISLRNSYDYDAIADQDARDMRDAGRDCA